MKNFTGNFTSDLLSKFKNYDTPLQDISKGVRESLNKNSVRATVTEDLIDRFTDARYSYFDLEGFNIYLESQFDQVEQYLVYMGVSPDSNLLGDLGMTIAKSPAEIFRTIENEAKCNFKVSEAGSGEDYQGYLVTTENKEQGIVHIIGISSFSLGDHIISNAGRDMASAVLETFLRLPSNIDEGHLPDKYPFRIHEEFTGLLELQDVKESDVPWDYFHGAIVSILNKGIREMGLKLYPHMDHAGGFIVTNKEYNILKDFAEGLAKGLKKLKFIKNRKKENNIARPQI